MCDGFDLIHRCEAYGLKCMRVGSYTNPIPQTKIYDTKFDPKGHKEYLKLLVFSLFKLSMGM